MLWSPRSLLGKGRAAIWRNLICRWQGGYPTAGGMVQRPPPTTWRPIKSDWQWRLGIVLFRICLLVVYALTLSPMPKAARIENFWPPSPTSLAHCASFPHSKLPPASMPSAQGLCLEHSSTSLLLHTLLTAAYLTGLFLDTFSRKVSLTPTKQVRTE